MIKITIGILFAISGIIAAIVAIVTDGFILTILCMVIAVFGLVGGVVGIKDGVTENKKAAAEVEQRKAELAEAERKRLQEIAAKAERKAKAQAAMVAHEKWLSEQQENARKKISAILHIPLAIEKPAAVRNHVTSLPEIKMSNITRSTKIDSLFPIVVLDTETTGLSPSKERIIEIAAIKYGRGFIPESCISTFVNPERPIPCSASSINHITDEMVANAPKYKYIAHQVEEYLNGCTVVGHNVLFDLKFIFAGGSNIAPKKVIDTCELAKKVLKNQGGRTYNYKASEYVVNNDWDVENYKLCTLCDYYRIISSDTHRALSDCYSTAELLKKLLADKVEYEAKV